MGMGAAQKLTPMSVEEYLARELDSRVKHEYLGGFVYAQAGANNVHNLVASNVLGALHARLRVYAMPRVQLPTRKIRVSCHARAILLPRCFGDLANRIRATILFRIVQRSSWKFFPRKLAESTKVRRKTLI